MLKAFNSSIKKYLKAQYPNEGCGIIADDKFIPCLNVADNPTERFQISSSVKEQYRGKIKAVIHSHPDGLQCPSASDMWGQMEMSIPWGIARTSKYECGDLFWFGDQVKKEQLIGRGFRHGVTDCYGLIRDWYAEEKNIRLNDFPRNWEWWKAGNQNLYESEFNKAGFRRLKTDEQPQIGDLCLMMIKSKVINHAGVLIDQNAILHHIGSSKEYAPDRLSTREPIAKWKKYIEYWIRLHEAFTPEYIEKD